MLVHYTTFGCKVNYCDTESIADLMTRAGFERTDSLENADIEIVNSCTVTENAHRRVRAALRQAKRANPEMITLLCGCYSQAYPEDAASIDCADIVTGNTVRADIPALVKRYIEEHEKVTSFLPHAKGELYELLPQGSLDDHTRAFLKIEDGCDRYCRYCAIPYARGHIRSIPLKEIKLRAKELHERGFKEIVLTGINLAMAGSDLDYSVADAAHILSDIGVERIRLSSLEPDLIPEEMMKDLSRVRGLCPHFHLSLQSGCDRTLLSMGRKYRAHEYKEITDRLRYYFDDPTFTTDVIVGFPGESDEDFYESLSFVENFGFLKVHVFPYSMRPGTAAAKMSGHLPKSVKTGRAEIMGEACLRSRENVMNSFIGKRVTMLTEQLKNGWWYGYTERYVPVKIKAVPGIYQNMTVNGVCIENRGGTVTIE